MLDTRARYSLDAHFTKVRDFRNSVSIFNRIEEEQAARPNMLRFSMKQSPISISSRDPGGSPDIVFDS